MARPRIPLDHLPVLIVVLCLAFTATHCVAQKYPHTLTTDSGMVVSDSSLASRVGRDALAAGGNAVDAAVATAFALAVTWPEAGNIGGGGFMVIHPGDGAKPVCVDYREVAPLAAHENTYDKNSSTYNRKAVGVPATVRGLATAHEKYGKLPWKDLVLPAAKLASNGFTVTQPLANSTNRVLGLTNGKELYSELHRCYGKPDGSKWQAGEVMKLPDLAKTLTIIANDGPNAFYQGPLADLLVKEMEQGTGIIRQADLDAYQAKIRAAIVGAFNGYEVIGAPPPSSGGTCIVQMLNIVEALQPPKDRFAPETIHLLAEAARRAFLDRARHIGDPDFVEVPKHLTSKEYAKELAASIDREKATNSEQLAPEIKIADESPDTTHFSVVDSNGMAVSNTYTLEASWGSRMVVAGAGYVLNNEMGDFNWFKGVTNRRGRIGTDANLIRPQKRMLSSQCPVIVTRDGKAVLVTGSPGGRTIINTVFGIVLNHCYFEMNAAEAVRAPRFHHQWLPDQLQLEFSDTSPVSEAIKPLEAMGHKIVRRGSQGSAHTIYVDAKSGAITGVADPRRDGRAAGTDSNRLACWNFGESKGTSMKAASSIGKLNTSWMTEVDVFEIDGEEHLTIGKQNSSKARVCLAPLDQHSSKKLSVIIELDGVSFEGETRNERLLVGFGNTQEIPTAIGLFRKKDNHICVAGGTTGSGTLTKETVIATTNQIAEPLTLRLDVDSLANEYSVWMKKGSQIKFTKLGTATMPSNATFSHLGIVSMGDWTSENDYLNVDRIEIRIAQ